MILTQLLLSNYKQYRHLELDFREGLVGVIGKNGAGKSTIFEAILYCLFGRDEGSKAHIRSTFAEDPKATVLLELGFEIGEIHYKVRREFRGKAMSVNAEFFKNSELVAKGVSAVNEELVKVLHMEREAFKRSVFSGQKELSELSDTSGEARKKMIRKMLGLDTLDDVQAKVGSDIRDLNSQIIGQQQNLLDEDAIKELEAEAKKLDKELKIKLQLLEKENKALSKTEAEYKIKKDIFEQEEARLKQHHTLERMLVQTRERLASLTEQKDSLQNKLSALQKQKSELEKQRESFANFESDKKQVQVLELQRQKQVNRASVLSRIEEHKQQLQTSKQHLDEFQLQLAEKDKTEQNLQQHKLDYISLEQQMEQKRNELRGVDQQIAGLNASLQERKEKLESLKTIGRDGTCPTCLQPLLDGYEKVLAELDTQIQQLQQKELQSLDAQKKKITDEGLQLKSRQTALRSKVDELMVLQSKLAQVEKQRQVEDANFQRYTVNLKRDELILEEIGSSNFDETLFNALKKKQAEEAPLYLEFQKAENYLSRELPLTEETLQKTANSISEASHTISVKDAELKALDFQEAVYLKAKEAFTGFDEAYSRQSGIVRQLERESLEMKNTREQISAKQRSNETIKSRISDKLEEIELLRKLWEHLGNFKTEILEKVSPGISKEASDLFSRITKGKYESILVNENFDFYIADGGQYFPIDRFSGGEVDLANFCLRIAVTKAIMDLSGSDHRLEFLAFDEIFGSQDEERRLEMMLALNYLQEQFRQIYIVSHIENLRDYFPNLLEVQFESNGSHAIWR